MNLQTLQEFESRLISQGYSKSYARRFADELLDHSLELANGMSDANDSPMARESTIPQRLGTVQTLTDAVNCHKELDPVPRKFPFVCFVLIPAILLNLWIWFALNWIYDLTNPSQRVFAVNFSNTIYYLFLAILPVAGLWLSRRYRVSGEYVALLTIGLAVSSLFGTTIATCQNSQSAFVHSQWGFRWWQFLLPLVALMASQLAFGRNAIFGFNRTITPGIIRGNCKFDPILFGINVVLLMLLIAGSTYWISGSLESVRKHPIDNLVQGFNSRDRKVGRALNVLRTDNIPLESSLQPIVKEIVAEHDAKLNRIYDHTEASDQESFNKAMAEARLVSHEAFDRIADQISRDQMELIMRAGLNQVGWQALYDPDLRQFIDLSVYQFTRFKDVQLKDIHENQRLVRAWRGAPQSEKPGFVEQLKQLKSKTSARCATILTDQQIQKFEQYCGTQLSSTRLSMRRVVEKSPHSK